ncbi:MAG: ABC transporter substrate-binding protein, partial [Clostridia bacterium]|nr:ABC transporter substrate-binding protein [Clostridia bacterium]
EVKGFNSNGDITGDIITTSTVDNLGYGYIGICATTVNVGGEKDSDASKALRKAFATLFSVHRNTVINSYYGERASVIEYPISNTSWAAPRPADEGYEIAYSTDVDGNQIYTDAMTEQERYDAALQTAIGYFQAAGFTWDEATGTFTAAPAGCELVYEAQIPGDGIGDHPAYGILTAAKEQLATIGITLEIVDLTNSNDLWTALESGNCQMWAAAWGATIDPDMYQVYHSSNVVGLPGSTESNHYGIQDAELDELIIAARQSSDQSYRKATYKQCLDIILDWGVEVPTYQRQNAIIFSTERVNMETVTPDITTFYGWMSEIENIEVIVG